MSKSLAVSTARLVITAVVVEGRSQAEVARSYGVSKGWVSKLVARYRAEGEAAFEPRSRRPKTSPAAITPEMVELIIRLRKELSCSARAASSMPRPSRLCSWTTRVTATPEARSSRASTTARSSSGRLVARVEIFSEKIRVTPAVLRESSWVSGVDLQPNRIAR